MKVNLLRILIIIASTFILFTANPALSYVPDDLDFVPMGDGAVSEAPSHADIIPEKPESYVVDLADIIDNSSEYKLNQYLRELEQKTTAQLVILTIKSLEGGSIEDFSITIAHDRWKLGQKGKDNGILFLISLKDKKYRIEVGYGLEGVIPDSLAGTIGRSYLVPFFRKGEYSKGVYVTALALANEIAADSGVKITGMPKIKGSVQRTGKDQPVSLMGKIMMPGLPRSHAGAYLVPTLLRGNAYGNKDGINEGKFVKDSYYNCFNIYFFHCTSRHVLCL